MRRPYALLFWLPLVSLLPLLACTTEHITKEVTDRAPAFPAADDTTSDAAPEASAVDAAVPDADNGGACNALVDDAPPVSVGSSTMKPPEMTGGPIADGTYVLTFFTVFADPDGGTPPGLGQELTLMIAIKGKTAQEVGSNGGLVNDAQSFTISTSSSAMITKQTCPGKTTSSVSYTATPTRLLRRWTQNGFEIVQVLDKR